MNHLGYKVFVIKKKANFTDIFLTRASSCKYDSTHKLNPRDDGNCLWCKDHSKKNNLNFEDEGH